MLDSARRNCQDVFLTLLEDRQVPKVEMIRGLERGLQVLQALQSSPIASLHDLYLATRISKPSLLRILHTLGRSGLVTRRLADGRYRIGATLSHAPSRRAHPT